MYKHILIPTDGSDLSKEAVSYGISLAKAVNADVTAITVTVPFHTYTLDSAMLEDTPESYKKRMTALAAKCLDQVKDAAKAGVKKCETIHVEHEHPYQAIIDAAKARSCDLIVIASHGRRGVAAIVLGSETLKVLTHSTVPVLVYRGSPPRVM
jgi:nucleotide-binding universal stress UspA family protein